MRAHQQPGPHQQTSAAKTLHRDLLAQRLEAAVSGAGGDLGARVGQRLQGRIFLRAGGAETGVHADARDQLVVLDAAGQALGQRAHLARHVGAGVDGGVPLAVGEQREIAVAISDAVFGFGEQARPAEPPMQQRQPVATRQRLCGEMAAEEACAAEDE